MSVDREEDMTFLHRSHYPTCLCHHHSAIFRTPGCKQCYHGNATHTHTHTHILISKLILLWWQIDV